MSLITSNDTALLYQKSSGLVIPLTWTLSNNVITYKDKSNYINETVKITFGEEFYELKEKKIFFYKDSYNFLEEDVDLQFMHIDNHPKKDIFLPYLSEK